MTVHLLDPTDAERARFASKIAVQDNGCWLWTGGLFSSGYAAFKMRGQNRRAHKVLWVWEFGLVPAGLVLDHLCHGPYCGGGPTCLHRRCVNPEHLAAVPQRSNLLRSPQTPNAKNVAKTHCKHGHEFTPENTYLFQRTAETTERHCRSCGVEKQRRYLERKNGVTS